jgi:hypothetical protein|tara:strand:- start:8853 stop:9263 length:411 start_codon:yes stop_codon:yes gene_type:complete
LTYNVKRVVSLDEIELHRQVIKKYLHKVLLKATEVTEESVMESIFKGNSQLWLVKCNEEEVVGIVVTNPVTYPTTKRLLIHLLGGTEIQKWVHNISTIEDWAKSKGLEGIEIRGRKGWLKLLPDYSCKTVLMIKEL